MDNFPFADEQMQEIWLDFIAHFKNHITAESYQSDLREFVTFVKKDFLKVNAGDVRKYYEFQKKKTEQKKLQPSTLAKKVREINSFSEYLLENQERLGIPDTYENYFTPYMKVIKKVSNYANSIPTEHIDKLLKAAEKNMMDYCILTFLYRIGLSSTEIGELKPGSIGAYDNGVYLTVPGRQDACFMPEDVYRILLRYLALREDNEFLFFNSRGNKLNPMYISRLMKKYTTSAGVPAYSAEALRNSCIYTMFAYHAGPEQIAKEMGVTDSQIRRYNNINYIDTSSREIRNMVKIRVDEPDENL